MSDSGSSTSKIPVNQEHVGVSRLLLSAKERVDPQARARGQEARLDAEAARVVVNIADDDHVIAAAVAARAELIVTGDSKHLLPVGSYQGIAIVTAREVVDRLEGTRKT